MAVSELKQNELAIKHYIGEKIRERRKALNISQTELAKRVGIKPQQLFKYEKGMDRISAGQLLELSKALSVPVNFFYKEEVDFQDPYSELVVMCTSEQGKKFTLKLLDEDHIFSEMKIAKNKIQGD